MDEINVHIEEINSAMVLLYIPIFKTGSVEALFIFLLILKNTQISEYDHGPSMLFHNEEPSFKIGPMSFQI